ncbi:MAG: lactonase family protein [Acidobacteria bacterium]|nr:lactonase family protein [Acidobacteriota bacterium]MDA1236632.1 lactonase family protein [Acidobacteriota bacterium]
MFTEVRLLAMVSSLLAVFFVGCAGSDPASQSEAAQGTHIAYVGTYTGGASSSGVQRPTGGSEGIYAFRFDSASGELTALGLASESPNPSFLALHPSGDYLYAVNEGDPVQESGGSISAFEIDHATGALTFLNKVDSKGQAPCHLVVDKTGSAVFAANYVSGSVVSYRLNHDGSIGELASFFQHEGSSVTPRQAGPHAHGTYLSASNRFLFVPDLGMDKVVIYDVTATTGELANHNPPSVSLPAGTGPRHFAFAPDEQQAYVLGELASTITVFSYDAASGEMTEKQSVSTLPEGFDDPSTTAEIATSSDGKFVYASNRGHDSIAIFSVDPANGTLTLVEHEPTQGRTPRNFAIDPSGDYLFAGNQATHNIVQFRRDAESGKLSATGLVLDSPSPICMVFAPAN